jgi:hypothetical protein
VKSISYSYFLHEIGVGFAMKAFSLSAQSPMQRIDRPFAEAGHFLAPIDQDYSAT